MNILICFLTFLTCSLFGQGLRSPGFMASMPQLNVSTNAPPPAACSTSRDTATGATYWNLDVGNSTGTKYVSAYFVAGASYTVCKAVLKLYKQNNPTVNLKVGIYSDSAGAPNVLVGSISDPVSAVSVPATEGDVTFLNISASLTSGSTYYVVLLYDSAPDYVNWVKWPSKSILPTRDKAMAYSGTGTAGDWSNYDSSMVGKFTLYSQ